MKKLIFPVAVMMLCFIVSCSNPPASESKEKMDADRNRTNLMNVYKGIESGDMNNMDSFLMPDAIDHGGMEEVKSRDSIKKMLSDMHNHFSNLKMEIVAEGTASGGDYHFALVRMTGTTKDDMMGMPANTPVDMTSVDVVKIKDGKAAEHWSYESAKNMMKMMELHKDMAPAMDKPKDTTMKK